MKWLRRIGIVLVGLILVAVTARLAAPALARALLRSETLHPADLIVVLGSHRMERTLEAADLYKEGWSKRILLLRSAGEVNANLMHRLQIQFPVWVDMQKSVLRQRGIPDAAVEASATEMGTTQDEAAFTVALAKRTGVKRMIVVTSPYHTRRAGNYFRDEAAGGVEIIMRADRYERYDPSVWWRRPIDRHDVILEYLKLIVHGFPFLTRD